MYMYMYIYVYISYIIYKIKALLINQNKYAKVVTSLC